MSETHTSNAARVLATIPSFAGLDAASLEALAQIAIRRDYAAGQVVFLEGEPCTGLYVVQVGWLRSVKISPTGREQVIRIVGPGESFNEVGVFAGGVNHVTVEALEPARLWILLREQLLQSIERHPRLAQALIRNLAQRSLHLMSLIEDLSLRTVESRLARLLIEQASDEVVHRRRWSTQAEMAARLGTVPDVLNRALRSLVEAGLIEIDRHKITILDRQGLEEKAMIGA